MKSILQNSIQQHLLRTEKKSFPCPTKTLAHLQRHTQPEWSYRAWSSPYNYYIFRHYKRLSLLFLIITFLEEDEEDEHFNKNYYHRHWFHSSQDKSDKRSANNPSSRWTVSVGALWRRRGTLDIWASLFCPITICTSDPISHRFFQGLGRGSKVKNSHENDDIHRLANITFAWRSILFQAFEMNTMPISEYK